LFDVSAPTAAARPGRELAALLYGRDPWPRLVAVEPSGADALTLYRRDPAGALHKETAPGLLWLLAGAGSLDLLPDAPLEVQELAGAAPLNRLVRYAARAQLARAVGALRGAALPHFSYTSAVTQYLTLSGRTLFYDMRFEELHRLQLDVETTTLQAAAPGAAVLLAAVTDNRGHEEVLSAREGGEAALLRRLTERLQALDPDVIEGHNLIDFDLPYLAARAARHGVPLTWGREGQPVWLHEREGRYKVGARILPSMRVHVYGRHVVDTFQQIQRYDSQGKLESYALKPAIEALELLRPGREFVDRTRINDLWESDPQRLARYCLDDARDVRALAELITPTEFYQTQIVPRSYQDVATGGTGEKINALMVRAYVAAGHALPVPELPRPYPGGYTELRAAGVFRRVVKCDVESLYPALMLRYRYRPATDTLDVFLPLLDDLTRRRLAAKRRLARATGADRAYWNGLSSSYKVLINSFYGSLGYSRAVFNDFAAAEQVTTKGQELIKEVLGALEARGSEIIEVDTDGVYFVPPPEVATEAQEVAFVAAVGKVLPPGINLAHDGRYAGMVSLKQKTYFLQTYDGRLLATGSSLRSRRDERYLRRFVQEAAVTLIEGELAEVAALYLHQAQRIQGGELTVGEFARRESITTKTHTSPGLRRLAAAAQGVPVGRQVQVYQRRDGSLALVDEYAGDEDREYLLRRLHDMARRFAALAPGGEKGEPFKRLFPLLKGTGEPPGEQPVQLSLFE
jgi:DNA polymerase elongation subunit (family B)